MNFNDLFGLFVKAFGIYETDKAIIDAGQVAATPAVQIGSNNGEPLYARVQLSTDKTFGGTQAAAAAVAH